MGFMTKLSVAMKNSMVLNVVVASSVINAMTAGSVDGVKGSPSVACLTDGIQLSVITKEPFRGHIYVRNYFKSDNADCYRSYDVPVPRQSVSFYGSLVTCAAQRERRTEPAGVSFSLVVTVQFHRSFQTKVDRTYRLTCFYREMETLATQSVHVSMLTPVEISHDRALPQCTYTVHQGSLNGPQVRHTQVGEKVFHRWRCIGDEYGMVVHSCLARAKDGEKYELIDAQGCATDDSVLGDLSYDSSLTSAYTAVDAFKFANSVQVAFQCQIRLCNRFEASEGCESQTPPKCGRSKKLFSAVTSAPFSLSGHRIKRAELSTEDAHFLQLDVATDDIFVFNVDEPSDVNDTTVSVLPSATDLTAMARSLVCVDRSQITILYCGVVLSILIAGGVCITFFALPRIRKRGICQYVYP